MRVGEPNRSLPRGGVIQVAGVLDEAEGRMLLEMGVDWLGFPIGLTVHAEEITPGAAREIVRRLELGNRGVLITYLNRAEDILALCGAIGLRKVQLHGAITLSELRSLRAAEPQFFLLKSLVVSEGNLLELQELMRAVASYVDAFITDTYDPLTSACGATGKTHDWSVSRQLAETSIRPVILAGGLRAENVRDAILRVRPGGVDAHTGLEDLQGRKDPDRVRAFVSEARQAFAEIDSASSRMPT